MSSTFRLRGYQHDDVLRLTGDIYRLMAIIYGTGGGKTGTSLAVAGLRLEACPALAVLVVASQTPIGDQFIDRAGTAFELEGTVHRFPATYTRRCATRAQIKSYLSTLGNREGRMVVTTYQALLGCEAMLRDTLTAGRPILCIIDEGHHTPQVEEGRDDPNAQKFGHLISRLSRDFENLQTLKLTGTPYRSDNKTVVGGDTIVCSKRIIELMHEGYAPRTVLTDHVTLPADVDGAIAGIAQKWLEDGRPTAVLRVKLGLAVVPALAVALERAGANVVNTTGEDGAKALTDAVRRDEQGLLPRGTVFITMVRMVEGVNVRTMTHAYFWGVPQSMVIVEQLLGRTMRLRVVGDRLDPKNVVPIAHVPAEWAVQSKVTFFFQETADGDSAVDHARLILRTMLFLSTFENPSWVAKQLLGIKDGVPVFRTPSDPVEFSDQRKLTLALEVVEGFWHAEWKERADPSSRINMETQPMAFATPVFGWYAANPALRLPDDPPLSREDIMEALLYRQKMVVAKREERAAPKAQQPEADEELIQDVVDDLIDEFHEATYDGDHYSLWSGNVNYWAERVNRDLLERIDGQPKTPAEILARVRHFHTAKGRLPSPKDEDEIPKKPVRFGRYDQILETARLPRFVHFVCSQFEKQDMSSVVDDLLSLAGDSTFLEHSRQHAERTLKSRTSGRVVAYYWCSAILAGGRCGIRCPPGVDPSELLELLEAVDKTFNSRTKLGTVRAVYRQEGLAGVRALLETAHEQTPMAPD